MGAPSFLLATENGKQMRLTIGKYDGHKYVDLREWKKEESDNITATTRGVPLTLTEFEMLQDVVKYMHPRQVFLSSHQNVGCAVLGDEVILRWNIEEPIEITLSSQAVSTLKRKMKKIVRTIINF